MYTMSNIQEILKKLSLSKHEILVYLSLLSRGELSVTELSKYTKVHRPHVYASLETLVSKNIVTKVPHGKRTHYHAESPKRLLTMVDTLQTEMEEVLPELEEMYSAKSKRPLVQYLEGKKGIGVVFLDVVESLGRGDIFYRYSSARDQDHVNTYVPKRYRSIRDKKGLERYVITNKKAGSKKKPRMERDMKFINEEDELFDQNIIQFIYGDKIALMDFNTDSAVIVENAAIADFQKKLFKTLFRRL